MKKFIAIFFVLALSVCVYADHPLSTDNTTFEAKVDTAITTIDTIVSVDSQTVVSSYTLDPERGWNYFLVNKTITGTNAANAELIVKIRVYNSSGTLKSDWVIDTIVGAASQAIRLPFGYKCIGNNYTIKLIGGGANGAEVITNGLEIMRYRPTNWNK